MTFRFYRLRFRFRAVDALVFPPFQSGNIARGAFGGMFRRLACRPDCLDPKICEMRDRCVYARVFEPKAARGGSPSGLADWPRPFVFRASHLDGRTIEPGQEFHFDVQLFDTREPAIAFFVRAFAQLAREGFGPGRGRAALESAGQLDPEGATIARIFDGKQTGGLAAPSQIDLGEPAREAGRVTVRFVTPTELKPQTTAAAPEFAILFARLRDRASTLRALYGDGPLEIDFRAMGERASAVRTVRSELTWVNAQRRSSRTGQIHPLGGFTGEVEYAGDLGKFLPYLRLGKWTGVGRQTVWGKGEIEIVEGV